MDETEVIVESITPLTAWLLEHGTRILLILLVAVVGYRLFYVLARRVKEQVQRRDAIEDSAMDKRAETLFNVITSAGLTLVVTATTLTILQEVDIEIAPLLASVGIVGLALGLGAQTLVQDVISGLFILIENQYTVGETVEINGLVGTVEQMTLRVTALRDLEGVLHLIPNGEIRIVSNRARDWARAIVDVGITYEADVDLAMETLQSIGDTLVDDPDFGPLLLEAPTVTGIEGLDDWQIRLRLMVKTLPTQRFNVERHLRREIQQVFGEKGLGLASPRQEVVVLQPEPRAGDE